MATLKSQKMVRGRDLKTPLAASTMDKKSNGNGLGSKIAAGVGKNTKAGPGDPPKKKNVTTKPPRRTVVVRPGKPRRTFGKGEFEKMPGYAKAKADGAFTVKDKDGKRTITYKN